MEMWKCAMLGLRERRKGGEFGDVVERRNPEERMAIRIWFELGKLLERFASIVGYSHDAGQW